MSEASLANLPGNHLPGLDMGLVERERKEMWSRMFQKYEDMEEMDEMSEEITLEDIDKPETVEKIFKEKLQSQFVQPSSIVKQYLMEHAEEMDEIATIAGPAVSDEEDLGDDSEDELLYSSGNDAHNVADDVEDEDCMENNFTPVEDIDLDNDGNISGSLVGLDDDLYNAALETKNLFDRNHNPQSFCEPVNKKPRFKSPPRYCIGQPSDENVLMIGQEGSNSRESVDNHLDGTAQKPHIVCCQCLTSTFYYALPVREQLVCDECLAGDHRDCEVEECTVCMEVGELISLRRQAEMFGRLEHSKLELSCSELSEKTVICEEDETRNPCKIISSVVTAVDASTICNTTEDEGSQIETDAGSMVSGTSSSSTEDDDAGGQPGHQFLPPLAQCGAGQYPSSLVSQTSHHKYGLNKVYPGPGCSPVTLYYCCTKKSQGCKGKCKVRLDKENKVELVLFSDIEHNH